MAESFCDPLIMNEDKILEKIRKEWNLEFWIFGPSFPFFGIISIIISGILQKIIFGTLIRQILETSRLIQEISGQLLTRPIVRTQRMIRQRLERISIFRIHFLLFFTLIMEKQHVLESYSRLSSSLVAHKSSTHRLSPKKNRSSPTFYHSMLFTGKMIQPQLFIYFSKLKNWLL